MGEQLVNSSEAARALFVELAYAATERAGFAYLDPEWRLLGVRHASCGSVDAVALPIRLVVGDALACGAAYVVMAHNHPGGDPTPSRGDLAATRRLARALEPLGVRLIEHVVLAGEARVSLRAEGWL